jgi:DNA-binding NtrC family response regulator
VPLALQVKLLRATESKEIYSVGSTRPVKVDTRIIAATNKDLGQEIAQGRFREDLYYRLNVLEIAIPPLRERKEDIPLLVRHFVQKYNKELNKSFKGVDNDTMKALLNYPWKGNVRELENAIERAMILGEGEFISLNELPPPLIPDTSQPTREDNLKQAMKVYEREHIINVMKKTGNDKKEASRLLGMSLASLYRKIEELNISNKDLDS